MFNRFVLPQTLKNPSEGTFSCKLEGTSPSVLAAEQLNLAFDYHLVDKRMRLVLSVMQRPQDDSATGVAIHGVEIAFEKDIVSSRFAIASGKVLACYWQLAAENGQTIYRAFQADSGLFELDFNEQTESYKGSFSFECAESVDFNTGQLKVTEGTFVVSGRDDFTL